MSSLRHFGLVVLLFSIAITSREAAAQQRAGTQQRPATTRTASASQVAASPVAGSWELGMDMDVGIGLSTPKSLFIDIPAGLIRAGYFVSDVFSLEPALAFNSLAMRGETGQSRWLLQIGGLYHLAPDRAQMQVFIHPAIGFSGGSSTNTVTHLSAGVGVKQPILNNRLAMRAQVGLDHRIRSGPVPSATSVIAFLGWSVYTR